MFNRWYIIVIVLVQLICATFFLLTILSSIFGFAPFSWHISELIEIGAAVGLFLGVLLGVLLLRKMMVRNTHIEDQLRLASGEYRRCGEL